MKKVLLIRSSGQLLGAERVVIELAQQLPEFSYHPIIGLPVEIGQPIPALSETAENLGLQVKHFPIRHAFDFSIIKKIREYVKEENIDIIHSHGYREDMYAYFARKSTKLVATNHLWKRTTLKLKIYAWLDALLLRKFDHVIAVSDEILLDMKNSGISPRKMNMISNGINIQRCQIEETKKESKKILNIAEDKLVLVTISSLTPEKGIKVALDAVGQLIKNYPNILLLIVGDGRDSEYLKQYSKDTNLSNHVTFLGRREDVNRLLNAADIYLIPSFKEGLPISLLEAMAAGKPVIATAVGQVPEVISSDVGVLIKSGSLSELTSSIKRLIDDEAMRKKLSFNASQHIKENYSSNRMTKENVAIYKSVSG